MLGGRRRRMSRAHQRGTDREGEPARTPDGDAPPPKEEKARTSTIRPAHRSHQLRPSQSPEVLPGSRCRDSEKRLVGLEQRRRASGCRGRGTRRGFKWRIAFHMRHTMTDPDRVLPDTGDTQVPSVAVSQRCRQERRRLRAARALNELLIRFAAPGVRRRARQPYSS